MRNKLYIPTTSTIFFFLTIITILLSWIAGIYGKKGIQNLLSADSLRWELRNIIPNYINTPALGIVITLFLGFGLCLHSGLLQTLRNFILTKSSVTKKERRSLFLTSITLFIYILIFFVLTFSPLSVLRGITGTLENSAFSAGIYYIISFGAGLCGITYGFSTGAFRNDKDIIIGMTYLLKKFSVYFVSLFFIAQFFNFLLFSGIPQYMGIEEKSILFVFYLTSYSPILQLFIKNMRKSSTKKSSKHLEK